MSTSTEMVPSNGHLPSDYTSEQIAVIRNTIARDCSEPELALFIGACKRAGLDPLQKQIYAMKMGGKLSIQTSIDGFRVIAERSGKYRGQVGPFWCGADGKWVDVWLDKNPPAAAKVGVLHRDFAEPLWGVARFASYSQGRGLWQQMGEVMIAKVAEALALRKAFPNDLSGLYTADEMDQAQGNAPRSALTSKPRTVAEFKAQATKIAEDTPPPSAPDEPEIEAKIEEPEPENPDGPEPPANVTLPGIDPNERTPAAVATSLALKLGAIENEHHLKQHKRKYALDYKWVKEQSPADYARIVAAGNEAKARLGI